MKRETVHRYCITASFARGTFPYGAYVFAPTVEAAFADFEKLVKKELGLHVDKIENEVDIQETEIPK